jgi:protein TonB
MSARHSATAVNKVVPLRRRTKHAHQAARKSMITALDARIARLEALVAQIDRRVTRGSFDRPFQISLAASVLLHLLLITLVTFKMPDMGKASNDRPMEVVLVNARTKEKPLNARALAQHNLDRGGNTDADRRAKTPLPILRRDPRLSDVSQAQQRVAQLEQEVRRQVLTLRKSKYAASATPPQPERRAETAPVATPMPNEADVRRSLELQRLEAEISRDMSAYQKRPRRHSMGASTAEYRFARYVEDTIPRRPLREEKSTAACC